MNETTKRSAAKDQAILAWFAKYLDNEPVSAIDRDAIETLRRLAVADGKSLANIDRYMALLRAILRKCECEGRCLDHAPAVPMYRPAQTEPRWLRHTFASWAVQRGVTLQELMQLGDWRSCSMVLRYSHLAPDQLAKAAEK